MIHNIS